jgi:hypothetical protein
MQSPDDQGTPPPSRASGGIGFGLFLLFAGCVLLAQRLGYIPSNVDWLFPAILIVWGASEIYSRTKRPGA